ncbi:hypothetical protein WJX72_002027 [[Myrmecia] bisecta]|uniref:Uncharacterized protein n=1 Tax=[Myrmecia] bisecta TaxID=41462 RepID=A0AAW1PTQ2_9CHLO
MLQKQAEFRWRHGQAAPRQHRVLEAFSSRACRLKKAAHAVAITSLVVVGLRRKHIISADTDGKLKVWQVQFGANGGTSIKQVYVCDAHASTINFMSANASHTRLATVGDDCRVVLWDITSPATTKVLRCFTEHCSFVMSCRFDASGCLLVSASLDGSFRIWHADLQQAVGVVDTGRPVLFAAFSPDDSAVVYSSGEAGTGMWDLRRLAGMRDLLALLRQAGKQSHTGAEQVAQRAAMQLIYASSLQQDPLARSWLPTISPISPPRVHGVPPLVPPGAGAHTRACLLAAGPGVDDLEEPADEVLHALVVRYEDANQQNSPVFDRSANSYQYRFTGHVNVAFGLLPLDSRHVLTTASSEFQATHKIWNQDDGRGVATCHMGRGAGGLLCRPAVSRDGQVVVSGCDSGRVHVWTVSKVLRQSHLPEARAGNYVACVRDHASAVTAIALSADDQMLASGDSAGTIVVRS